MVLFQFVVQDRLLVYCWIFRVFNLAFSSAYMKLHKAHCISPVFYEPIIENSFRLGDFDPLDDSYVAIKLPLRS